jgi:hypothetical protein
MMLLSVDIMASKVYTDSANTGITGYQHTGNSGTSGITGYQHTGSLLKGL